MIREISVALVAVALVGCASSSRPVTRCCYIGAATTASLQDVQVVLGDGERVAFPVIADGFEMVETLPQTFPLEKLELGEIVDPKIEAHMREYDPNDDGYLEMPELTAMYVLEIARGLGYPAQSIIAGEPTLALHTSGAEIGGLLKYVGTHLQQFTQSSRDLFEEVDRQAFWDELRNSDDRDTPKLIVN